MAPVADDIRIHQDWPGPEEDRATGLAALEGRELQVIEEAAGGVVHGGHEFMCAPVAPCEIVDNEIVGTFLTAREICVRNEVAFLKAPAQELTAAMVESYRRSVEKMMFDCFTLPSDMQRENKPPTPPANPIRAAIELHQVGRFRIGQHMIDHEAETVAEILAGLVIVRAEYRFEMHGIEYVAYGPGFAPIWPGAEPPLYVAEMCEEPHACGIKRTMTGWRRA